MASKPPPSSASLYGIQRPKNTVSQKDLTSSSTLAFTTHLSSLINKEAASKQTGGAGEGSSAIRGRARPSKTSKSDIFSVHNKGAQKRAAVDEEDDDNHALQQTHKRTDDIGQVDAATLHRSKRRMEEKARLYEDLKKGYHLAEDSSDEDNSRDDYVARMRRKEREALVDFDRKWAEEEAAKRERGEDSDANDEEDDEDADEDETGSLVEYEDEFGRTRQGTRAEAARAAQLRRQQQGEQGQELRDRSRPERPANLIYGETIQTEAFKPDAAVAAKMEYLASRRDRSPTPPEATHYDPDAEVRTRGTAFYAFSRDEKQREKEMEELMNARKETEREREARSERKAERERLKEERRKKIQELRGKRQAERFLEGLGQDLAQT